jgi:hypothetical protein
LEFEFEIRQKEIDAEEDFFVKQQKQLELNNDKREHEIDKKYRGKRNK